MFKFTISTSHAKDLLHAWAFLTPEEEEAVLAIEGPERTEMVHRLMAQNFMPGAWHKILGHQSMHHLGPFRSFNGEYSLFFFRGEEGPGVE